MNLITLRNILFKAFVINYALLILVWLLSLSGFYHYVLALFHVMPEADVDTYLAILLGGWDVIGFVLFLVPALALHWVRARAL